MQSSAPENSAATSSFIGRRRVQIAFPPQRQTDLGRLVKQGWARRISPTPAARRQTRTLKLPAGVARWDMKTLISLVLRDGFLTLSSRSRPIAKVRVG